MEIQWPWRQLQAMTESGKGPWAPLALKAGDQLTAAVLEVDKGRDALLSFGQFRAYARLPVPVVSGQDLKIRVEPAGQHLRMVLIPEGGGEGREPAGDRLAIRLFEPVTDQLTIAAHTGRLKAGMTLHGRITGFEKDGLQLVDFGQFKAFTKIDIPVRQGQVVPLAVLQSGREITLALDSAARPGAPAGVSPASGPPGPPQAPTMPVTSTVSRPVDPSGPAAIRSAVTTAGEPHTLPAMADLRDQVNQLLAGLPHKGSAAVPIELAAPMKQALVNLQQMLQPVSPAADGHTLVARLQAFVEHSGVYFEKRLEREIQHIHRRSGTLSAAELAEHPKIRNLMRMDMKPNLLIVNKFIDSQIVYAQAADRHMLETMRSIVQRALTHIERQQLGATEKPVDPDVQHAFSHLLVLAENQTNTRLKIYYDRKGNEGDQKTPRVSLLLNMDPMGMVRSDLWMIAKDLTVTFFVPNEDIQALVQQEQHRIAEALQPAFNTVAVNVVVNVKKIEEFDGEDLAHPNQRQLDVNA